MTQHERWTALLDLVARTDRITVEDAAEELDVSTATIRRDLAHLAQQQLLTRTRGGAVASNVAYDLPLRYKTGRHAAEKQRIAAAAAKMIGPGATVGLNGGTTTTEVARAIATRADLHGDGGAAAVTIVTNALNIAHELVVRPHVKIVVIGGVARPQSYELIGPLAMPILQQITLDTAILGVDAIDVAVGASAHHEGEASINALMVERARQVIAVADGSKLGAHAFARICPVSAIDVLITDTGAAERDVQPFASAGARVVRA